MSYIYKQDYYKGVTVTQANERIGTVFVFFYIKAVLHFSLKQFSHKFSCFSNVNRDG